LESSIGFRCGRMGSAAFANINARWSAIRWRTRRHMKESRPMAYAKDILAPLLNL
jgi:hypothetical protein